MRSISALVELAQNIEDGSKVLPPPLMLSDDRRTHLPLLVLDTGGTTSSKALLADLHGTDAIPYFLLTKAALLNNRC